LPIRYHYSSFVKYNLSNNSCRNYDIDIRGIEYLELPVHNMLIMECTFSTFKQFTCFLVNEVIGTHFKIIIIS